MNNALPLKFYKFVLNLGKSKVGTEIWRWTMNVQSLNLLPKDYKKEENIGNKRGKNGFVTKWRHAEKWAGWRILETRRSSNTKRYTFHSFIHSFASRKLDVKAEEDPPTFFDLVFVVVVLVTAINSDMVRWFVRVFQSEHTLHRQSEYRMNKFTNIVCNNCHESFVRFITRIQWIIK